MLLGGFCRKVEAIFIVLDRSDWIKRSLILDMSWCRRMWSVFSKAHLIAVTSTYYSVLGGAYCSLGKSNTKYVSWRSIDESHALLIFDSQSYKAGLLAMEQIKLAQRLKDPILECKCWLYYAEDLIQLGKLKEAQRIITLQRKFVDSLQEDTVRIQHVKRQRKKRLTLVLQLVSMLDAVIGKMNSAVTLKTKNTKSTSYQVVDTT